MTVVVREAIVALGEWRRLLRSGEPISEEIRDGLIGVLDTYEQTLLHVDDIARRRGFILQ